MDTKWKKSKIILSSIAFFLGMTLLISNVISVAGLSLATRGTIWKGGDYQESKEFRWYISNQLEELLGVATGGKSWNSYYGTDVWRSNYSTALEDEFLESAVSEGYAESELDKLYDVLEKLDMRIDSKEATGAEEEDMLENLSDWLYGLIDEIADYDRMTYGTDDYMAEKAQNKNLRYAVVYQGKLIYTNIDGFENAIGQSWEGTDFYAKLAPEEYNFSLWFNREGDGKVQIAKGGKEKDVYGNGVYTEESLWFVPGYTNFMVDASANDAVIFLAAAREPKIYVVGNYSEYGTVQYEGRLYWLQQNLLDQRRELRRSCILLLISAALLLLSLAWRKEKRSGDQAVADFMGKIWLEPKLLLLVILPILLFFLSNNWEFMEWTRIPRDYDYWGEVLSYSGTMFMNRIFLTGCFWIAYLAVLDFRRNKGKQKKTIWNHLSTGDLKYPLQKRLVRRSRMTFMVMVAGILVLFLPVLMLVGVWGIKNNYYDWIYVLEDFGYVPWKYFLGTPVILVAILAAAGIFIIVLTFLICLIISLVNMKKDRQLVRDIGALADQIQEIKEGNLTKPLKLPEDADLKQAADNLNEIQHGMDVALREQIKSERMKVDLVTNVSHDIKTPLTSIVSYVDLLKQEEELPPHVEEFIQILDEKSQRLKTIVQDVFEISKATSGQLPVNVEELNLGKLLRQTLADMDTQIEESGLVMKVSIPEAPVLIQADGQRLYRVFQNLIQNALKYSLQGSRIFLTLTDTEEASVVRLRNTSGVELDDTMDFTERFLRGDSSRTDGGSGLGLSIAKSFTEACGGSFQVEVDADLFTVIVTFPKGQTGPGII